MLEFLLSHPMRRDDHKEPFTRVLWLEYGTPEHAEAAKVQLMASQAEHTPIIAPTIAAEVGKEGKEGKEGKNGEKEGSGDADKDKDAASATATEGGGIGGMKAAKEASMEEEVEKMKKDAANRWKPSRINYAAERRPKNLPKQYGNILNRGHAKARVAYDVVRALELAVALDRVNKLDADEAAEQGAVVAGEVFDVVAGRSDVAAGIASHSAGKLAMICT